MDKDEEATFIISSDTPICPHCKRELPVPGLASEKYGCPGCGGFFTVKKESMVVFKTEMWFDDN